MNVVIVVVLDIATGISRLSGGQQKAMVYG